MDGEPPTVVRVEEKSVLVVQNSAGVWRALIPGWETMDPFSTKLEAITYAEEWLLDRI